MLHDFDKYIVHLIPAKPTTPHELQHESTLRCWCKPMQDPDEPTVVIHNDAN